MTDATRCKKWISMMIAGAMALTVSGALLARDPGINQRGAAGNKGAGAVKDPGINRAGRCWKRRRDSWQGSRNQPARRGRQQARRSRQGPRRQSARCGGECRWRGSGQGRRRQPTGRSRKPGGRWPVAVATHRRSEETDTMRSTTSFLNGLLTILVAIAAALPIASVAQADEIDADALQLLRRSTDYLAGAKQFRIDTDSTIEIVLPNGQKLQYGQRVVVTVARPNRMRVERWGR